MSGMLWAMARKVSILVILLATVAGLILPHWHTEWSGPGCELCHIRSLPSNSAPVADGPVALVVAEQDWISDDPSAELESCVLATSSRAPPRSIKFNS
ncbi:MAG TPA: hypothetical protein VE422_48310 [Terriglobia bacterium]|nr:hypothetical protein [Terriglobia bacterium]